MREGRKKGGDVTGPVIERGTRPGIEGQTMLW